jgi:hypothetical protein
MPEQGPTFTDWAQLEADDRRRPLLIDEDFSWSEPPARRRRPSVATVEREARAAARKQDEYDDRSSHSDDYGDRSAYAARDGYDDRDPYAQYEEPAAGRGRQQPAHREDSWGPEPINVEHELDVAWGGRLSAPAGAETYEVDPYDFEPSMGLDASGRRTVVITGRGASSYPVRRPRSSELAFHERDGFSPDRTAMWAVLLGIALLIGCIAH